MSPKAPLLTLHVMPGQHVGPIPFGLPLFQFVEMFLTRHPNQQQNDGVDQEDDDDDDIVDSDDDLQEPQKNESTATTTTAKNGTNTNTATNTKKTKNSNKRKSNEPNNLLFRGAKISHPRFPGTADIEVELPSAGLILCFDAHSYRFVAAWFTPVNATCIVEVHVGGLQICKAGRTSAPELPTLRRIVDVLGPTSPGTFRQDDDKLYDVVYPGCVISFIIPTEAYKAELLDQTAGTAGSHQKHANNMIRKQETTFKDGTTPVAQRIVWHSMEPGSQAARGLRHHHHHHAASSFSGQFRGGTPSSPISPSSSSYPQQFAMANLGPQASISQIMVGSWAAKTLVQTGSFLAAEVMPGVGVKFHCRPPSDENVNLFPSQASYGSNLDLASNNGGTVIAGSESAAQSRLSQHQQNLISASSHQQRYLSSSSGSTKKILRTCEILLGQSPQDVISLFGQPQIVWPHISRSDNVIGHAVMLVVSRQSDISGASATSRNSAFAGKNSSEAVRPGFSFCYPALGFNVIFSSTNRVESILLSNSVPGHEYFLRYARCPFALFGTESTCLGLLGISLGDLFQQQQQQIGNYNHGYGGQQNKNNNNNNNNSGESESNNNKNNSTSSSTTATATIQKKKDAVVFSSNQPTPLSAAATGIIIKNTQQTQQQTATVSNNNNNNNNTTKASGKAGKKGKQDTNSIINVASSSTSKKTTGHYGLQHDDDDDFNNDSGGTSPPQTPPALTPINRSPQISASQPIGSSQSVPPMNVSQQGEQQNQLPPSSVNAMIDSAAAMNLQESQNVSKVFDMYSTWSDVSNHIAGIARDRLSQIPVPTGGPPSSSSNITTSASSSSSPSPSLQQNHQHHQLSEQQILLEKASMIPPGLSISAHEGPLRVVPLHGLCFTIASSGAIASVQVGRLHRRVARTAVETLTGHKIRLPVRSDISSATASTAAPRTLNTNNNNNNSAGLTSGGGGGMFVVDDVLAEFDDCFNSDPESDDGSDVDLVNEDEVHEEESKLSERLQRDEESRRNSAKTSAGTSASTSPTNGGQSNGNNNNNNKSPPTSSTPTPSLVPTTTTTELSQQDKSQNANGTSSSSSTSPIHPLQPKEIQQQQKSENNSASSLTSPMPSMRERTQGPDSFDDVDEQNRKKRNSAQQQQENMQKLNESSTSAKAENDLRVSNTGDTSFDAVDEDVDDLGDDHDVVVEQDKNDSNNHKKPDSTPRMTDKNVVASASLKQSTNIQNEKQQHEQQNSTSNLSNVSQGELPSVVQTSMSNSSSSAHHDINNNNQPSQRHFGFDDDGIDDNDDEDDSSKKEKSKHVDPLSHHNNDHLLVDYEDDFESVDQENVTKKEANDKKPKNRHDDENDNNDDNNDDDEEVISNQNDATTDGTVSPANNDDDDDARNVSPPLLEQIDEYGENGAALPRSSSSVMDKQNNRRSTSSQQSRGSQNKNSKNKNTNSSNKKNKNKH